MTCDLCLTPQEIVTARINQKQHLDNDNMLIMHYDLHSSFQMLQHCRKSKQRAVVKIYQMLSTHFSKYNLCTLDYGHYKNTPGISALLP